MRLPLLCMLYVMVMALPSCVTQLDVHAIRSLLFIAYSICD